MTALLITGSFSRFVVVFKLLLHSSYFNLNLKLAAHKKNKRPSFESPSVSKPSRQAF